MSLKNYRFSIEREDTKEIARFIGQGDTVDAAWKDGLGNCNSQFRPKSDGQARNNVQGCAVTLPSGEIVKKLLKEFEADAPATSPANSTPQD